jgi:hypothetical protein
VPVKDPLDRGAVVFLQARHPLHDAIGSIERNGRCTWLGEPPGPQQPVQVDHVIGVPVGDDHGIDTLAAGRT